MIYIIIVVICACLLIGVLIMNKRREKQYDERQLLARNQAFKTAFFTLISYCYICGMLNLLDVMWADITVQMCFGVMLSVTVFAIISIIKDAYLDFTSKRKWRFIVSAFGIGTLNIIAFLLKAVKNDANIISSFPILTISICLYTVAGVATAKSIIESKSRDE